jgi:SAM-dependent methyltransferase
MKIQTTERVGTAELSDNYVLQRSIFAYKQAAGRIGGNVLEIGTGTGYGITHIAPYVSTFTTVDKHSHGFPVGEHMNVSFVQQEVPPLANHADNTYDYVIAFQLIEHIEDDHFFLREVERVLKPGGTFIMTTPSRTMSLTRNPWHVREYTGDELAGIVAKYFYSVEKLGVYGNEAVMNYYAINKETVQGITKYDIFNLQHLLPRFLLKIPYNIMNRLSRRKILESNTHLTSHLKADDFLLKPLGENCLDLFYIAKKKG